MDRSIALAGLLVGAVMTAGCMTPRADPSTTFVAGASWGSGPVAIGHLDDDDIPDAVIAGEARLGDGRGGYGPSIGGVRCVACDEAIAVAIADLDRDGSGDVVALLPGQVVLSTTRPPGPTGPYGPGAVDVPEASTSLALADIDNDHDIDIIVGGGGVHVLDANGDGTYGAARQIARFGGDTFAFAFINDDMLLDLAVAVEDGVASLDLHLNDDAKNGTFQRLGAVDLVPAGQAGSIQPVDVTGDQRIDLVVATDHRLMVLANDGRNGFSELTDPVAPGGPTATQVAGAADLDNDGQLDLVLAYRDAVHWATRRADGWTDVKHVMDVTDLEGLAIVDANDDGRLDILASTKNSTHLAINDGQAGHAFRMHLQGNVSNPDGFGTKVTLAAGTGITFHQTGGVASPALAIPPDAHFGLGADPASSYSLAILWPSGILQFDNAERDLLVDQWLVATESMSEAPWETC